MSVLTDCASCGGLLPAGKACCPHCHCKYPLMKRWRLLVAAALGVGAAGCNNHPPVVHYGPGIIITDLSATPDAAKASDLATPQDGGTD